MDHGVQHGGDVLTDRLGRRQHQFAGYRISLLRHRRRGAPARDKRFGYFTEFGRRHHHDVGCDLAERTSDQAEQGHGLGYAIARNVPGHRRLAKAELLAEQFLHFQPAFSDRCEGARGPGKFPDKDPRQGLRATLDMPVDGGKPDGRLVAKGDRERLLEMGPARHRRVAIFACQARKAIA